MWLCSELGKGEYACLITIVLVALSLKKLRLAPSLLLIFAALGAGVTTEIIKADVARPRPLSAMGESVHVVGEELRQRSFPSGHTACAFALLTCAGGILRRRRAWMVGSALASLVGLSRIFVGAHYPGDVLGGALLGMLCGTLAARAYAWISARETSMHQG